MVSFLHARVVNDIFGDPSLFLDFHYSKRALLFDIGEIEALTERELRRVSHVFVSHAHMDHFSGFDRMLRHRLNSSAPLNLVGPQEFIERVEAKLAGYTWNLLDGRSADFVLAVAEFSDERIARRSVFRARRMFQREDTVLPPVGGDRLVIDEADFSIEAEALDHGIPCLAFAFEEKMRIHVVEHRLAELGLSPGAWLNEAKRAVRQGAGDATLVTAGEGNLIELGELRRRCFTMVPGQKIVYVVDAADHSANRRAIVNLARGADQLFIEAAFADEDADLARNRRHLTAGAAGRLAREARVKSVTPLHVSTRYAGQADRLALQVERAFLAPTAQGDARGD